MHAKDAVGGNRVVFAAEIASLDAVMEYLDAALEEAEAPMKAATRIRIAADEVFSNIAQYSGAAEAAVCLQMNDEELLLTFEDDGAAYNPLEREEPDITVGAQERQIGGLGIFVVKRMMDDVAYERADGRNVLTLRLHI